MTVIKVYSPQDGQIQVHQNRVAPCRHNYLLDQSGMGREEPGLANHQNELTVCCEVTPSQIKESVLTEDVSPNVSASLQQMQQVL